MNSPLSVRIQSWLCADDFREMIFRLELPSRPSPPATLNCTMASTVPDCMATTCGCRSPKNTHSTESSGVLPPHHDSLRTKVAPTLASYLVIFHGPVPLRDLSSVVPSGWALGMIAAWAFPVETR